MHDTFPLMAMCMLRCNEHGVIFVEYIVPKQRLNTPEMA